MGGFKPADLHMAMDFSEAAAAAAAAAGGHPDKDLRLDFGSFGGEARSSEHSGGSAGKDRTPYHLALQLQNFQQLLFVLV